MKKSIIVFLSFCGLTACATFPSQSSVDWRGENFDNYVLKYGVPAAQVALQSGNIAYSYTSPCPDSPNMQETIVMVNQDNTITNITPKSSCPSVYQVQQEPQVDFFTKQEQKLEQKKHNKNIDKELSSVNSQISYYQTMIESHETSLSLAKTELSLVSNYQDTWTKANMLSPREYEEKIKQLQEELNQFKQKKAALETKKAQLEASYW